MKRILLIPLMLLQAQEQTPTFRVTSRLVEVYATVFDKQDHRIGGLKEHEFDVLDGGNPQRIERFEASTEGLALTIVMDTTGSMRDSLPVVKNAISLLIDQLRDEDLVSVYGFAGSLERLQEFTRDKRAAKLAVRRTRAEGRTALFDALTRVSQELHARPGKKAVVVFTDGADNSSVLNLETAALRARKTGVPVYVVAQGEALSATKLMKSLEVISEKTGGQLFRAQKSSQMDEIFMAIAADLKFTYMLAYYAPTIGTGEWRPIRVSVKADGRFRVRCKEGYFAE
ncbi:VWA domain-containing protein [Paludibaculum fermentans]|uniref:VWA domain-containing protein n=1 Tax=Paludibaculum fermentans TaxID=1473598 RepID=UPI003EBA36E2